MPSKGGHDVNGSSFHALLRARNHLVCLPGARRSETVHGVALQIAEASEVAWIFRACNVLFEKVRSPDIPDKGGFHEGRSTELRCKASGAAFFLIAQDALAHPLMLILSPEADHLSATFSAEVSR